MKFCEQLGKYIEQLSCTAKELCELSGISPSTFSRYRSGERIPEIDTVTGFATLLRLWQGKKAMAI